MPLSAPQDRKRLHRRRYLFEGFERADGLWEIEGHITDEKSYGFPNEHRGWVEAGEPIHDMSIRLTLDDKLEIKAIEAVTDASPYAVCPAITVNFQRMVGVKIGRGWRKEIYKRLGGVEGCTHLVELLATMATPAYQAIFPGLSRRRRERVAAGQEDEDSATRNSWPGLVDSCHAYDRRGALAQQLWPQLRPKENPPAEES